MEKYIKKDYDLTPLTTFRIGGRAEFFIAVKDKDELIEAIEWAKLNKIAIRFFSGGSNILIIKKKISGLVIKISGAEYSLAGETISAWAGTSLAKLSEVAAKLGLSGLEWASGIPGSLGGAVRGNAGAYGSDISRQVVEVEAYDLARGRMVTLKNLACGFSYRQSIFKKNKNLFIIRVKLKLSRGQVKEIKKITRANFKQRALSNPRQPSAGCIFKNLEYKKLVKENHKLAEALMAKGLFRGGKIGAGYLIAQSGLSGRVNGGAKISRKHANFIINSGRATAKEVIGLINLIKRKIKSRYKINLEEEVQYFGG